MVVKLAAAMKLHLENGEQRQRPCRFNPPAEHNERARANPAKESDRQSKNNIPQEESDPRKIK